MISFSDTLTTMKIAHAIVILAAWSGHAFAQNIERALPPCDKETLSQAQTGADQNDARSVYLLARYYSTGKCLSGDGTKAMELYLKAAALNYPRAFYNLGIIHASYGDFESAESFFLQGAELGHRGSELQLGILYAIVPPPVGDPVKGAAWLSFTASRPEGIADEAKDILEGQKKRMEPTVWEPASKMAETLRNKYGPIPEFKE